MALFSKKQTVSPRRRRVVEQPVKPSNPFRRGRTLTGSTSLASAAETTAQLKSPRARAHELAKKRRHIGGLLLLMFLASASLYFLISQFTSRVTVRATDGISLASSTLYEDAIQAYLAQHPAERLRFLLNTEALNAFIQTKTPEVASVEQLGGTDFATSAYRLTMRDPIAGWNMANKKQFVDATGRAFEKNYFASPEVQIIDKSGVPQEVGQAVTSNRFLGFVGRAVGMTKTYGYKVKEVIIPEGTTREIEVKLDGVAYPIKLSVDRSAGEQVEDMARSVKWLHDKGKNPQYLDVRVTSKAFYKE